MMVHPVSLATSRTVTRYSASCATTFIFNVFRAVSWAVSDRRGHEGRDNGGDLSV